MQAKERLTGAIILVVLIVLVVPELLMGPRTGAPSGGASSTVEGPPMRSYTIELGERAPARPAQPQSRAAIDAIEPATSTAERSPAAQTISAPPATSEPREPAPKEQVPAAAAERVPAAEPPPVTGWSIQVGSFASRENADRLVAKLRGRGFRSFVAEGTGGGRKLYRVRVGPERDRAAAQQLAARLKAVGESGSIVAPP
ncbi:MAG: SPOR domain-containing protein [Gammaproteobacteria bacterium]